MDLGDLWSKPHTQVNLKQTSSIVKCWICRENPAETGEHRLKASDLRSIFGTPNQDEPLYFHNSDCRNLKVQSLRSQILKFRAYICKKCNNTRTQPYDRAWQRFSEALRLRRPPIAGGDIIRLNRVFPYNTTQEMRNVHFFFLKLFGCQIVDYSIPIDIALFSESILRKQPHPNLYLAFGPAPDRSFKTAGMSNVQTQQLNGRCVFAAWLYEVDNLWVNIIYAVKGENRQGMVNAWHPSCGHNRLVMTNFLPDEN